MLDKTHYVKTGSVTDIDNETCVLLGESAYARFTSACAQRMVNAGYKTEPTEGREGESDGE